VRFCLTILFASLLLVGGCGESGSESPPLGKSGSESPRVDDAAIKKQQLMECVQLGIDWATGVGHSKRIDVAFGTSKALLEVQPFGQRQAARLQAADCSKNFVREAQAGNAGLASTLRGIDRCLQRITPSIDNQQFCDDAMHTYERSVLSHVSRMRALVSAAQATY